MENKEIKNEKMFINEIKQRGVFLNQYKNSLENVRKIAKKAMKKFHSISMKKVDGGYLYPKLTLQQIAELEKELYFDMCFKQIKAKNLQFFYGKQAKDLDCEILNFNISMLDYKELKRRFYKIDPDKTIVNSSLDEMINIFSQYEFDMGNGKIKKQQENLEIIEKASVEIDKRLEQSKLNLNLKLNKTISHLI